MQWWKGQLERRYLLQRAWCIHDAYMTHQEKPTAPLPALLQDRVAAGQALPEVEMAGGHEEEELNAVLAYVATLRDAPLFREFMQYLHGPRSRMRRLVRRV
jgi:hypothetical protein